jgi:hypothetical protein
MSSAAAFFGVLAVFAAVAIASWKWGSDSRVGRDWEWREAPHEDVATRPRRALRATRQFLADQAELHERLALMNRPWEERFLHWSGDPDSPRLHGSVPPPRDGRRRSVTRGGWCPGLSREEHAANRSGADSRPEIRS